jgi:hypothetical protein
MDHRADLYRRNAAEAERRAGRAKAAEEREALLRIAQGWRNLQAEHARRALRNIDRRGEAAERREDASGLSSGPAGS